MIGIVLQFIGVTLSTFVGYGAVGEMAMPLLPTQIAAAIWLMAKGFNERFSEPNTEPGFK